ncbi:MAG: S41 family peptidase [Woeseiaceae bacterium]|nr:S41 family peptidase [Woeseiaceae bacterium]
MIRLISALLVMASLAACGGGSGNGGLGQGGANNNDEWQEGVFLDWRGFYQQCGNTLAQNNFLRSYSNDTYLWYDEIIDRDPALYNDPVAYFDLLRTNQLSPSGQPKDKFHFTYDSDVWNQLSQSGASAGYGIQWAFLSNTPPRDLRIAYTEPNSPATNLALPLERGAQILEIDGVDINDNTQAGVDTLNAGIRPSEGTQHTFTVRDVGATATRTVTMTAEVITSAPVQNTQVISTPTGAVGYLTFNDHIATAEQALIDAVDQLNAHDNGAGIDDLVLDLRYNGGGYGDIANELAYMIAGPVPTAGRSFNTRQFNDKHPVTDPVTGNPLAPTLFYDEAIGSPFNGTAGDPLPTLDLPRVFVLTGFGTASASELIINGLRGVGVEVIQVGATTRGKPYGFYPTDNCGTTYFTIQMRSINDVGFGDYTDGFSPENTTGIMGVSVPGCSVADDFTKQLGDPTEARLAAALEYRDTQTCPAASAVVDGEPGEPALTVDEREPIVPKSPWHSNTIFRQ